ncbi:ODC1 [Cordylochernes scorpioides]|uniref:ornithine decarboxylase n=1 Tax=Cordylochernes scorpioides TaxID=51811 RepID=A0ABY6LD26_9ARAC|nr:ODC1 [Cordylochernes scorpioides]
MDSHSGPSSVEVVTGRSTIDIIKKRTSELNEDPFYVVDLGDIAGKYRLWRTKMPRVTPFYAVKCNDSPVVLELLTSLGTGFDCASKGEIEAVMKLGANGSNIIYANPCKNRAYIQFAQEVGVDMMTFDNEMELHKIAALFPAAKMVLRIRVDDSSAVCRLGQKFGADLKDCSHLLSVAQKLGLNVIGVSFHVGSGCTDARAYNEAISNSHTIFQMARNFGYTFNLLDIGGGFPGNPRPGATFEEIADVVTESLDQYFPVGCGIDIIAEPGRFFVASAFTLCTNVIAKRVLDIPNGKGLSDQVTQYYVNDGVYGSFNCLVFDHALVQPVALKRGRWEISLLEYICKILTQTNCSQNDGRSEGPMQRSGIWGPTCDSMDRIMEQCQLPDLDIGEWILFENMGAYTIAAASRFNGFEPPSLHLVLPLQAKLYLETFTTWDRLKANLDIKDPTHTPPLAHSENIQITTRPNSKIYV